MQTEFEFVLPRGYVDAHGAVHREGRMRLAMALDEVELTQDPRVRANESYLAILLLARVVTRLGDMPSVTPRVIEGLFASDVAYLQDLYQRLNSIDHVIVGAICPYCEKPFQVEVAPLG